MWQPLLSLELKNHLDTDRPPSLTPVNGRGMPALAPRRLNRDRPAWQHRNDRKRGSPTDSAPPNKHARRAPSPHPGGAVSTPPIALGPRRRSGLCNRGAPPFEKTALRDLRRRYITSESSSIARRQPVDVRRYTTEKLRRISQKNAGSKDNVRRSSRRCIFAFVEPAAAQSADGCGFANRQGAMDPGPPNIRPAHLARRRPLPGASGGMTGHGPDIVKTPKRRGMKLAPRSTEPNRATTARALM